VTIDRNLVLAESLTNNVDQLIKIGKELLNCHGGFGQTICQFRAAMLGGFAQKAKIPPTAVGGWFRSYLQTILFC
jgi:hypothetical protein